VLGVVTFEAVLAYIPFGQHVSAIQKAKRVQDLLSLEKVERMLSYYRKVQAATGAAKARYVRNPAMRLGGRMATKVADGKDIGVGKATEVFRGAKSVGKQWQIRDRVAEIPPAKLTALSVSARERLGSFLSRVSRSEATAIGKSDSDGLKSLFGSGCTASSRLYRSSQGTPIGQSHPGSPPCASDLDSVAHRSAVSADDFWSAYNRHLDELDTTEMRQLQNLIGKGTAGPEFLVKLDKRGLSYRTVLDEVGYQEMRKVMRYNWNDRRVNSEVVAKAKVMILKRATKRGPDEMGPMEYSPEEFIESIRAIERSDTPVKNFEQLLSKLGNKDINNVDKLAYESRRIRHYARKSTVQKITVDAKDGSGRSMDFDYRIDYDSGKTKLIEAKTPDASDNPNLARYLKNVEEKANQNPTLSSQGKVILEVNINIGSGSITKAQAKNAVQEWLSGKKNPEAVSVDRVRFVGEDGNAKVLRIQDGEVWWVNPNTMIERNPLSPFGGPDGVVA
jgi:hypothetical protein